MAAIKRFIVWALKTVFVLAFINLGYVLLTRSFMNKNSPSWKATLYGVSALVLWGFVIWASWQIEYRDGRQRFPRWLRSKMSWARIGSLFSVRVSDPLRQFTDQLHQDLQFDESKISEFKALVTKEPIPEDKKKKFLSQQFERVVERFSGDRKLDDREWAIVVKSLKFFKCEIPDMGKGITKTKLGDFRARGIISEGRLIEQHAERLPIKRSPDEKVFLVLPAVLLKRKKVTQRVNYSGVTASVNLGMGFRYRVGSIRPRAIKKEMVVVEDQGVFFVTSEKVGFHGDRKSWVTTLKTMTDVQVEEDVGLEVFKSGRENPVLIYPADLDTAAAVLSTVMNGDYEIDNGRVAI